MKAPSFGHYPGWSHTFNKSVWISARDKWASFETIYLRYLSQHRRYAMKYVFSTMWMFAADVTNDVLIWINPAAHSLYRYVSDYHCSVRTTPYLEIYCRQMEFDFQQELDFWDQSYEFRSMGDVSLITTRLTPTARSVETIFRPYGFV